MKTKNNRTTIPACLFDMTDEHKKELDTFMYDYNFMFRYAFKRYIEFEKVHSDSIDIQKEVQELEKELAKRTGYPIRVVKDAVYDAKQVVTSQHELMKDYYKQWIERYENTKAKYDKLSTIPTINLNSLRMIGLRMKMQKQQEKYLFYQTHVEKNTFPPVIFGGRQSFKKLQKGELSKEEWNEKRNGRVSSRGDATKGGNPNLRVLETENGFALQVISNRNIGSVNKPIYEKPIIPLYIATKRCKKTGALKGRKYPEMMHFVLEKGEAYEVEILKRKGKYCVHIVVKNESPPVNNSFEGVRAIDTNIDGLAICDMDLNGKPIDFKWLGDGGLQDYRSNKRENKIWEMSHEVVNGCLEKNLALVVEDLDQMHNRQMDKWLRRKIHQFCYRKLLECMETLCIRYGVKFIKVKPQYTSVIGRLKYQTKFRVNVHLSAAYVIGRRSLGFKEEIPKKLQSILTKKQKENFSDQNEWKQWSIVKTRITNLLKKRKAKFYQWHEFKTDVFETLNKKKPKKKEAIF